MSETEHVLEAVENVLGYTFNDRSLLMNALSHTSYVNEQGLPVFESYERLEFLGDSVIELSVTHLLFEDFPEAPEGELTKFRSPLVKGAALAEAAIRLGLGDYIFLGKGEESTGGRKKRSLLADTFESVVGAVYLDAGFEVARGMVISLLEKNIHQLLKWGTGDFKSELQEMAAKRRGVVPRYRIREEGPDHYKTFHAIVEVGDRKFGPVAGASKKEAEQGAARLAMKKLGWLESGGAGR